MEIRPMHTLGSWSLEGPALGQGIWKLVPSSPACKDVNPAPGQILARQPHRAHLCLQSSITLQEVFVPSSTTCLAPVCCASWG